METLPKRKGAQALAEVKLSPALNVGYAQTSDKYQLR